MGVPRVEQAGASSGRFGRVRRGLADPSFGAPWCSIEDNRRHTSRHSDAPLLPDEQSDGGPSSEVTAAQPGSPFGPRQDADCQKGVGGFAQICTFFIFPHSATPPSGQRSLSTQQSRQAPFTTLWLHPTFPVNSARHQPNGLTAEQGAERRHYANQPWMHFSSPGNFVCESLPARVPLCYSERQSLFSFFFLLLIMSCMCSNICNLS